MSNTLKNATAYGDGIASDETGANIASFRVVVEPEFIRTLDGIDGNVRGWAKGELKKTVSIAGDLVTTLAGVGLSTIGTPYVFANTSAYFGAPTTGLYLDRGEVTKARGAWVTFTADYTAYAGVA